MGYVRCVATTLCSGVQLSKKIPHQNPFMEEGHVKANPCQRLVLGGICWEFWHSSPRFAEPLAPLAPCFSANKPERAVKSSQEKPIIYQKEIFC